MLLEDNITFELPLEYREGLVAELKTPSRRLSDDDEAAISIGLDWQVLVCNIIRDVLEGRPANPGFLLSLQNCTHNQLDMIFSVSDGSLFINSGGYLFNSTSKQLSVFDHSCGLSMKLP